MVVSKVKEDQIEDAKAFFNPQSPINQPVNKSTKQSPPLEILRAKKRERKKLKTQRTNK